MSEVAKKRYRKNPISDAELAKWGRYWYGRLRDFHQAGNGWEWRFSEPQVISFVRRLLADGVPAWKRLKKDIEDFLTRLAVDDSVAAGTQDQAFYAILYLYQHVLDKDIGKIRALKSKKPKRLPVVLSREETLKLLSLLSGRDLLIAQLLYGIGTIGPIDARVDVDSASCRSPIETRRWLIRYRDDGGEVDGIVTVHAAMKL